MNAIRDGWRGRTSLQTSLLFESKNSHYVRNGSGALMKTMTARDAKNGFGLLLDTARAEPVTIEKHGRPVVVVLAVEEYEKLNGPASTRKPIRGRTRIKDKEAKAGRHG